jgi:hypothetical protein
MPAMSILTLGIRYLGLGSFHPNDNSSTVA